MHASYSAPGKVILSGEHSVVYGKPAVVSAINKRLTFSLKKSKQTEKIQLVEDIAEIVRQYLKKKGGLKYSGGYSYTITSDIPQARGLGSSAALSAAAVAAFLKLYTGKHQDLETINNLAYKAERKFHKNPSGADNTASVFGGLIFFRKEFEFLKSIFQLPFKIPKILEERLYLIDSGRSVESTAQMVERIGARFRSNPSDIKDTLNTLEIKTKQLVISIAKEDKKMFAQTIADNQKLLETLGTTSKKTKKLLQSLSQFGAGKITGAGGFKKGSGYILFYAANAQDLRAYCRKHEINYFKFKQSSEGVRKA
ncbi:MAG: mevalonate kinase [Candidatus Paceibacterota bacterium]